MGVDCHGYVCIWNWHVCAGPFTLCWAVCYTMGALASPLLGCSGHSLFHFHELLLFSGMACSIRLALDRTSLSPSHGFQSTPAPADQVVHLRWMSGSDHCSRINSATVHLPIAGASWLILSACHYTCLSRTLVHL